METEQEVAPASAGEERTDLCLCVTYLRATERAALAGARWLGRADQESAEEAAVSGMRGGLDELPMTGRVLIGAGDGETSMPETLGAGGIDVDLALDPLEGRGVVARGGNGAISMIVAAEPGKLRRLPDMYMRTIAAGPLARGRISLLAPVGDNVRAIADAFGRNVGDVTTIVLDRPRHHDLIEEIRAAGARIKLIQDGTVTASISAAIRGTNDHLAIGIGGTRQAVLTAGALRCLGGEVQAQLWPTSRREIEAAREYGIEDVEQVFTHRGSRLRRGDRRRHRRLERRPPARRPLPRRQRPHALARHVHPLQLGALHRRDPLLRAGAPRGSAATGLLGSDPPQGSDRSVEAPTTAEVG